MLKSKNIRIAVFGAGGLGSFVILELHRLGFRNVVVFDRDFVEEKNLERQIIYEEKDVGKKKVEVVKEKFGFEGIFKDVREIKDYNFDIIFDCLDNWESRKAIFKKAKENKIPVIHGAVGKRYGQFGILLHSLDKFEHINVKAEEIDVSRVGIIASFQVLTFLEFLEGKIKREFISLVDFEKKEMKTFCFEIFS